MFKYFLFGLLGLGLGWLINDHYDKASRPKPVKSDAQLKQEQQQAWEEANNRNGEYIRIWVDNKHGVVCYVLTRYPGMTGAIGGLSCLPKGQVIL